MKKIIKNIRKHIIKYILRIIIKHGESYVLNRFLYIFPKERYRMLFMLMQKGYLDLAYMHINNYAPKEHEKALIERIVSMQEIAKNGLKWSQYKMERVETISVLFVVHNSLPFDKAGYALKTHLTVKNLQNIGCDISVVTRAGYPWDLKKHRTDSAKAKNHMIDGVEYGRLDDEKKLFKKGADFDYINYYATELVKNIKKSKITILHAHSNYLNGLAAIRAAKISSIPVVYEMRGLWYLTRITLDERYEHYGMCTYEQQMEMAAATMAHKVVTISQSLRELLLSWGIDDDKIEVIPNSVDTIFFAPQQKNMRLIEKYQLVDKIVLGFVGSLTGYEGLKELVLAANELYTEGHDNIVLFIVGEGREGEALKDMANTKNIIFTGRVAFEEVKAYYSVFDICPLPRNNFEVCQYVPPLKILEAMAMQKAVIVSDINPLLEIIEDGVNGLVCQANNVNSLKSKILELSSDKIAREYLATNARDWVVQNRTKENIALQYKKLYGSFKDDTSF